MESITIDGVKFDLKAMRDQKQGRTTKQLLAQVVKENARNWSPNGESTLPDSLVLDGRSYDIITLRTWIAAGYGTSRSEVSDMDLIELITSDKDEFILEMLCRLPAWDRVLDKVRRLVSKQMVEEEVQKIRGLYVGKRGLMVVDVVASRRRRYESHVEKTILPAYLENAVDASLATLSTSPPDFLKLRVGEAKTMQEVAAFVLSYGSESDEESAVREFARRSKEAQVRESALEISGIGPVLYEYLRLLSGVDTIKVDSRVRDSLGLIGLPVHLFSDEGVLEVCKVIANLVGCSLVHLDQALWHYSNALKVS
jgi:hypothetical protein